MANSWNGPQLGSPIRTDVQELQKKLIALLKGDPTSVADIPSGAKRLVNTSGVQWQVQQYNGSSWAAIDKLMHDVDTLDGYHAAITPAANTVAVRNADKKLEGDITGNAATASSAATLSETLPVNKGGTGATTSAAARTNLGVPPMSHASSSATYGLATDSLYGHVKSDSSTTKLNVGQMTIVDVALEGNFGDLAGKDRGQIGRVASIPESGVDFHELTKSGVYFFTDVAISASKNTPPTNTGGFCVVYSRESQPYNYTKHIYYLCNSSVIYTEETKNNSMEWSNWVENINSTNVATNAKAGIVKPQTGATDGLELGPDGTLRLRVADQTVRGGVMASETPQAYTVPHSRADGTIDPNWMPSVLKRAGDQMDGEIIYSMGYAGRRNVDTEALALSGGTGYDGADATLLLYGKGNPNPENAGLVRLRSAGTLFSFGASGIYLSNNRHVLMHDDIYLDVIPNYGPVKYLPVGGTWIFMRVQFKGENGTILEASMHTEAGGSPVNISNENVQLIYAFRVSM